jgi:hypothetical protein
MFGVLFVILYFVLRFYLLPKVVSLKSLLLLDAVLCTAIAALTFAHGSWILGMLNALAAIWSGWSYTRQ